MTRASEYRSRKREPLYKLFVEETGETFLVRPAGLDAWIMAGRIPESLAREVLSGWQQASSADAAMANLSPDQMISGFQLMREMVIAVSVSPKIIIGDQEADPDKDEIHISELHPAERTAFIKYAMTGAGAEAIPGSVTAEAVARFPEG